MAKFTLIITDADNDEVELDASCEPSTGGHSAPFDKLTPAQQYAALVLEFLDKLREEPEKTKGKTKKG